MVLFRKCFMTNIVLLGGGGFIGSKLSQRLRELNYNVVIADMHRVADCTDSFLELDILSGSNFAEILKKFDVVINLTGQITSPISGCLRLNTQGITNILMALRGSSTLFIQISTVSVYGTADSVDEESILNPETPYAVCKSFAEFLVKQNLKEENYSILRLSNLFGTEQKKGFFSYIARAAKGDHTLEFNNDGSLLRYYLHIDDCVEAICLAVQKRLAGTYNVCGFKPYTIKDIIDIFDKTHKVKFSVEFSNVLPPENIKTISCNKFKELTGYLPMRSVEDYIKEIVLND